MTNIALYPEDSGNSPMISIKYAPRVEKVSHEDIGVHRAYFYEPINVLMNICL